MKTFFFTLIQFIWGFPQTVLGLSVWLVTTGSRRYRYRCANVTAWKLNRGLSLGPYIFIPDGLDKKTHKALLVHEYGH